MYDDSCIFPKKSNYEFNSICTYWITQRTSNTILLYYCGNKPKYQNWLENIRCLVPPVDAVYSKAVMDLES